MNDMTSTTHARLDDPAAAAPIAAVLGQGSRRHLGLLAIGLLFLFVVVPLIGNDYWLNSIIIPTIAMGLAGIGLNLLMGYTGLVSLGSAAFMAIGAFASYNLLLRLPFLPLPVVLLLAGVISGVIGAFFGLPSLRIRGFYLAASTLGAQFFFQWLFTNFKWFSNDTLTLTISAPRLEIFGWDLNTALGRYLLVLVTTTILAWIAYNIVTSRVGRDWMSIRDMNTAAAVIGTPVARRQLLAYGISSFYCGIAGALWAFAYLGTADGYTFNLDKSFQVLFIVLIGGSASILGNFLGAAFIILTPILLDVITLALGLTDSVDQGALANIQHIIFGALIIILLIKEPDGLTSLLKRGYQRIERRLALDSRRIARPQ
jgi:branched-chain amino acid transport system permease protein